MKRKTKSTVCELDTKAYNLLEKTEYNNMQTTNNNLLDMVILFVEN